MSNNERPAVGTIGWMDLTVDNAEEVRDFYASVVGWKASDVEMGGYRDFMMSLPDGTPEAGICHARGENAALPPQWLIYIIVADLDASLEECKARGGELIAGPRQYGEDGRYAVIRDPAGAPAALFQTGG